MSTSFLYHSSNVQGVKCLRTVYKGNKIIFHVEAQERLFRCEACRSSKVIKNGGKERLIRNLKIGHKVTYVSIFHYRLRCKCCGANRMMKLPFVKKWASYTRAVALKVLDLSRAMTLQDVAKYTGLSWRPLKKFRRNISPGDSQIPILKN